MADLNLEGGIALLGGGGEQRAEILVGQMEIEPARIGADAVAPRAQHLPQRQAGRLRRQIPYRLLQRFLERHAHPTNLAAARPADPVRERERDLAFERGPGLAAEHALADRKSVV